MSDTPETDDLSRGNHVVPTEWAEQLERERNEARADVAILRLDAQREAEHHDRMVSELEGLYDKNAILKRERDEARQDAQNYYLKVVELQQKLKEYDKLQS